MNQSERRIRIIIANYTLGKCSLQQLRDLLTRGLKHVDCLGAKGGDKSFILNLSAIEAAIERIERGQSKRREN